jgi:hypothetical protein
MDMTEDDAIDVRIGALLRGSDRAPDEVFVSRLERVLAAERRMEERRSAAWRRFAAEACASAAIAAAFVLIGRLSPPGVEADLTILSPAMAAALLIGVWLVVGFRPSLSEK